MAMAGGIPGPADDPMAASAVQGADFLLAEIPVAFMLDGDHNIPHFGKGGHGSSRIKALEVCTSDTDKLWDELIMEKLIKEKFHHSEKSALGDIELLNLTNASNVPYLMQRLVFRAGVGDEKGPKTCFFTGSRTHSDFPSSKLNNTTVQSTIEHYHFETRIFEINCIILVRMKHVHGLLQGDRPKFGKVPQTANTADAGVATCGGRHGGGGGAGAPATDMVSGAPRTTYQCLFSNTIDRVRCTGG